MIRELSNDLVSALRRKKNSQGLFFHCFKSSRIFRDGRSRGDSCRTCDARAQRYRRLIAAGDENRSRESATAAGGEIHRENSASGGGKKDAR
jgi:hypothetical protein